MIGTLIGAIAGKAVFGGSLKIIFGVVGIAVGSLVSIGVMHSCASGQAAKAELARAQEWAEENAAEYEKQRELARAAVMLTQDANRRIRKLQEIASRGVVEVVGEQECVYVLP